MRYGTLASLCGVAFLQGLAAGCGESGSDGTMSSGVATFDVPAPPAPAGTSVASPASGSMPPATTDPTATQTGAAGAGAAGDPTSGSAPAPMDGATMTMDDATMMDATGDDMGAAGTGGGMIAPPSPDSCGEPPADAPELAVRAWNAVNATRLAAGAGCMNLVPELIASAQGHCDYHAANAGNPTCTADSHGQLPTCAGFTGETVRDREIAAGYPSQLAYTQVYVTYGEPEPAVQSWLDTVYHRIPLYDPWTVDMGYGGGADCDVIDIGRGTPSVPDDTIVVLPYDGQTDVPPAWSGLEGPQPPPPPGGYPSSYPINIYAKDLAVTEHVLTVDGDDTPIEHLWLDENSPEIGGLRSYFGNTAFLYGAPLELSTTYRVKIVGTYAGGALDVEWTFTTGSMRPWGT